MQISSVFMIIAAIYSHKWGVVYFLIVTMIFMIFGIKVNLNNNKEKVD